MATASERRMARIKSLREARDAAYPSESGEGLQLRIRKHGTGVMLTFDIKYPTIKLPQSDG